MGLFSKRNKPLPDVYVYDEIPQRLRKQIINTFRGAMGVCRPQPESFANGLHLKIHEELCREHGEIQLAELPQNSTTAENVMYTFLLQVPDSSKFLDAVELYLKVFAVIRERQNPFISNTLSAEEAIQNVNRFFRESGVGYQFENNRIIQVDSAGLHQEIILPALRLLTDDAYKNANDEMMDAFKHLKKGEYAPAMVEAVKALESVLKIICGKHKWEVERGASSSKLFKAVFDNGLLPSYLQDQFNKLQNLLQGLLIGGAPALRNQPNAAHGGGLDGKEIPEYVAAYCIQTAAAAIVFLVNADKDFDNR